MFSRLRGPTLAVGALVAAGVASAGDTVRLVDRPTDRADTRLLDLKPADKDGDTERTCWFRGGYGCYGPRVSYFSYYYAPPVYSYYSYPAISYYSPPVYYSPVYYAPRAYYYSPPVFSYGYYYPISIAAREANGNGQPPARVPNGERPLEQKSFRYDGGPAKPPPTDRIPPARQAEPPPVPQPPVAPEVPKLGPSPSERTVALPAAPARRKLTYPAYGEDRQTSRDDRALLIRGPK